MILSATVLSLYKTFPFEPQFKYDNTRVYLLHKNGEYLSELPIPSSWKETRIYSQFINELKQYVDAEDNKVLENFFDDDMIVVSMDE